MTIEHANEILKLAITDCGGLFYVRARRILIWEPGENAATITGKFKADELDAITIFMRYSHLPAWVGPRERREQKRADRRRAKGLEPFPTPIRFPVGL